MSAEKRKLLRKDFSYYMRVMDEATGNLIGHISDISTGGFKVDSKNQIPLNVDFRVRIDQTGEVSNKSFMVFVARAKWCRPDEFEPGVYNTGFQIMNMTSADFDAFVKMFNAYAMQKPK